SCRLQTLVSRAMRCYPAPAKRRTREMRNFDLSSWQAILTSLIGLLLFTLIGMGIRLVMMMTVQARRERQNRQINERLKALIAAYKILGGSFTGTLAVNPAHLRDLRKAPAPDVDEGAG